MVDFQRLYHVDLQSEFAVRPWKWFRPLASGLMYLPDSLLRLALAEHTQQQDGEATE